MRRAQHRPRTDPLLQRLTVVLEPLTVPRVHRPHDPEGLHRQTDQLTGRRGVLDTTLLPQRDGRIELLEQAAELIENRPRQAILHQQLLSPGSRSSAPKRPANPPGRSAAWRRHRRSAPPAPAASRRAPRSPARHQGARPSTSRRPNTCPRPCVLSHSYILPWWWLQDGEASLGTVDDNFDEKIASPRFPETIVRDRTCIECANRCSGRRIILSRGR